MACLDKILSRDLTDCAILGQSGRPTLIRTTISQVFRTKQLKRSASLAHLQLSLFSVEAYGLHCSGDLEDPDLYDRVTPSPPRTNATLRHPGVNQRASPNMDALRSRNMSALASVVGLLLLAGRTSAHGGHMENIAEGEYMSADPIVCW